MFATVNFGSDTNDIKKDERSRGGDEGRKEGVTMTRVCAATDLDRLSMASHLFHRFVEDAATNGQAFHCLTR